MIRHCKLATETLTVISKETIALMKTKRNESHRTLVLKMFIEVFIADGAVKAAEGLIQTSLADPAYSYSAILSAYNVMITLFKAMAYVSEPELRSEDNPYGGENFILLLKKIIRNPFEFYDTAVVLETAPRSHNTGKAI